MSFLSKGEKYVKNAVNAVRDRLSALSRRMNDGNPPPSPPAAFLVRPEDNSLYAGGGIAGKAAINPDNALSAAAAPDCFREIFELRQAKLQAAMFVATARNNLGDDAESFLSRFTEWNSETINFSKFLDQIRNMERTENPYKKIFRKWNETVCLYSRDFRMCEWKPRTMVADRKDDSQSPVVAAAWDEISVDLDSFSAKAGRSLFSSRETLSENGRALLSSCPASEFENFSDLVLKKLETGKHKPIKLEMKNFRFMGSSLETELPAHGSDFAAIVDKILVESYPRLSIPRQNTGLNPKTGKTSSRITDLEDFSQYGNVMDYAMRCIIPSSKLNNDSENTRRFVSGCAGGVETIHVARDLSLRDIIGMDSKIFNLFAWNQDLKYDFESLPGNAGEIRKGERNAFSDIFGHISYSIDKISRERAGVEIHFKKLGMNPEELDSVYEQAIDKLDKKGIKSRYEPEARECVFFSSGKRIPGMDAAVHLDGNEYMALQIHERYSHELEKVLNELGDAKIRIDLRVSLDTTAKSDGFQISTAIHLREAGNLEQAEKLKKIINKNKNVRKALMSDFRIFSDPCQPPENIDAFIDKCCEFLPSVFSAFDDSPLLKLHLSDAAMREDSDYETYHDEAETDFVSMTM